MNTVRIDGTLRKDFSKAATKKARKEGLVPANFYGHEQSNIHFYIPLVELLELLNWIEPCLIELNIEGKKYKSVLRMAAHDFHPVNDMPIHADFLKVSDKKPITLAVPLAFSGASPGIQKGGELAVIQSTLPVKALVQDMPEKLNVDITGLELGEKITVKSINAGKIEILASSQTPVARILIPRALRSKASEKEENS